jgi:hypothetical protein
MSPWIKQSWYTAPKTDWRLTIISPHGSNGEAFLQKFSAINEHPAIRNLGELWQRYLFMEQDGGANALAHALARQLSRRQPNLSCDVVELDYPRGLIDGGRTAEHCLRSSLPADLAKTYHPLFVQIHRQSLDFFQFLYQSVTPDHLVLDLHTMASFQPLNGHGHPQTIPISWHRFREYCEQFNNSPKTNDNLRAIDIITKAPDGQRIADPWLDQAFWSRLTATEFSLADSTPYAARPEYLMHHHMVNCRAIAIDIPKHLLATTDDPMAFEVDNWSLDESKVEGMAGYLAQAIELTHRLSQSTDSTPCD